MMKKMILVAALALAFSHSAFAELQNVTIDIQNGSNYSSPIQVVEFLNTISIFQS